MRRFEPTCARVASSSRPRGSTSSPRPEHVEGREDRESAPAATGHDRRSAQASEWGPASLEKAIAARRRPMDAH